MEAQREAREFNESKNNFGPRHGVVYRVCNGAHWRYSRFFRNFHFFFLTCPNITTKMSPPAQRLDSCCSTPKSRSINWGPLYNSPCFRGEVWPRRLPQLGGRTSHDCVARATASLGNAPFDVLLRHFNAVKKNGYARLRNINVRHG